MLQLTDIRKSYQTYDFSQTALDGVTITFRDNEFAAVLGPSGSGKTTMLNIIGGLDHCDSGELKIDGISTEEYKSRDWDTYRNNRIGFVFQSYNLISHQSVLSNVELALTLSGVPAVERRDRAINALVRVGLGEHIKKRPNQLSGGQMQRVAIARALINDPEILLADEPTGALDTHTGWQVMELLTEIAKDRLVIMVTHNRELAEHYANRIVHLTDGKVTSDSRPFDPASEKQRFGRHPIRASMSFFTALALSFSNLMTKKGRTLVTALAGSIGIIGIAAILALANGINIYIQGVERETLSIYPLTIQTSGFDFSSFFSSDSDSGGNRRDGPGGGGGGSGGGGSGAYGGGSGTVRETRLVQTVFSYRNNNDLASLKAYIEENESLVSPYVDNIQYQYDIKPQIYLADTSHGIEQVNPDPILGAVGMGGGGGMGSMMGFGGTSFMSAFQELPGGLDMFAYQYNVVAGRWPESYDEAVLVISSSGRVSDFQLYAMGLRDRTELREMLETFMSGADDEIEFEDNGGYYTYEALMSVDFKVVNPTDLYQYDETYHVWVDKSSDKEYLKSLIDDGLSLRVVGIVQPDPNATATSLSSGVNYMPSLTGYLMDKAKDAKVVRDQLSRPTVNVLSGKNFLQESQESGRPAFQFTDLIAIDEDAIRNAFMVDDSQLDFDMAAFEGLSLDMPGMGAGMGTNMNLNLNMDDFDMSGLNLQDLDMSNLVLPDFDMSALDMPGMGMDMDMANVEMPDFDMQALTDAIAGQMNISPEQVTGLIGAMLGDFLRAEMAAGVTDPNQLSADLSAYLAQPEVQAIMAYQLSQMADMTQIQAQINEAMQAYVQTAMQSYMAQMQSALQASMQAAMQAYMQQVMEALQSQIQASLQTQMQTVITQMMTQMMTQIAGNLQSEIQSQIQDGMAAVETQLQEAMQNAMADLPEQLQNAVSIDQDAFADAFQLNMGEQEILELMTSLMSSEESTYERNMAAFGYADPDVPYQINIYPINFESKQEILRFLDNYNDQMEAEGKTERVVHYTDIVGTLMSSVTDIVNMVSYALMAFVAISLIVSSIMIGVITYISVLERTKEIGILRAIGASRRNIRRVFNAETLIVGFVAGTLGILITLLICIPANIIVANEAGIDQIAQLPVAAAVALIAISMFLTFIAGLLPAAAAARKDPVEALRSE